MAPGPAADHVVIPALLRAARGAYGNAIREKLALAGLDDMPRNGSYILGGMANHGGSTPELLRQLGIGQQAAAELVDTLVVRGYLDRSPDPDGPGGQTVVLTDRGRMAAAAIRRGVQSVDDELALRLTVEQLAGLYAGLAALTEIRERGEDSHRGASST